MPFRPERRGEVPTGVTIEVGDLVRVRSKQEIAETLDAKGKLKGLWFDREMVPFCGREFRVERKVTRFIDEASGRMVELASDCYMLENVVCSGDLSHGRRFCSRAIHPWWRTAWLEPVETGGRRRRERRRNRLEARRVRRPRCEPRRHAAHGFARRDVARDDRAGADQRVGADPHAAEDDRARADRRAALDDACRAASSRPRV